MPQFFMALFLVIGSLGIVDVKAFCDDVADTTCVENHLWFDTKEFGIHLENVGRFEGQWGHPNGEITIEQFFEGLAEANKNNHGWAYIDFIDWKFNRAIIFTLYFSDHVLRATPYVLRGTTRYICDKDIDYYKGNTCETVNYYEPWCADFDW